MTEEFQETQLNSEMTAGEMLHAARTTGRRKREISTIAKQLCIREEFLQALEDGNYTVLPELVYILGFARNYAMELGIDPDVIVKKIKSEMGIVSDDDEPVIHQMAVEMANQTKVTETINKKLCKFKESKSCKFLIKYWKWIVGAIVLFAIIGGIIGAIIASTESNNAVNTEVVATPAPSTEPAYRQTVRERFGTENREEGEIVIQAYEESWVKIEDARGKTVFSRVLVPGDLYYVPKGNKNKATFGNVGGVDIWVRGELAPKAGKDHTRKTGILLDPDTLMGITKAADKSTDKIATKTTDDKKTTVDAGGKNTTDKKTADTDTDKKKS